MFAVYIFSYAFIAVVAFSIIAALGKESLINFDIDNDDPFDMIVLCLFWPLSICAGIALGIGLLIAKIIVPFFVKGISWTIRETFKPRENV